MGSELTVSSDRGRGSTFSFHAFVDERPQEDKRAADALNGRSPFAVSQVEEDLELSEDDPFAEEVKMMTTKTIPRFNTDEEWNQGSSPRSVQSVSLSNENLFLGTTGLDNMEVAEELSFRGNDQRGRTIQTNSKKNIEQLQLSRSLSVPREGYQNGCGHPAILVVDDQGFNRLVMQDLLKRHFFIDVDLVRLCRSDIFCAG